MSHKNHTKIKEERRKSLISLPKSPISLNFQKNHKYFSILHLAKHPPNFRYIPPNFAQKPEESVNFQQISAKIPSNIVEIRVFHVKMKRIAVKDQQTQKLTKNEEYDGKQPLQPLRSWQRRQETRARRAKKRIQKKKKIFSFIIFLFTI